VATGGESEERDPPLNEVSCRNTLPIIHWLRLEGVPVDRTLSELGFDTVQLEDPSRNISWDDFGRFLAPFEQTLSDEDFRRMGRDLLDMPTLRLISVVASNAASISWLTQWVMRLTCGPKGMLYRGVEHELLVLSPTRLRLTLRALPGRRFPRGMALAFAGSLERMACLLGAPRASVELSWAPERFELHLRAAERRGLGARLDRLWRRVHRRGPADEVQAAYEQLMQANSALEEQLEALRRSERKREELELRLRQSQKMEAIGRFAGAIAHDFNNLLTVLSAHGEFAVLSLDAGEDPREDIEAIRQTVVRATALTRQLLAFGRQQLMNVRSLDLNHVIESLGSMLSTLAGERVKLELDLNAEVEQVVADRAQLEQILTNVCVNARDAMPRGGLLRIETRTQYFDEAFVAEHPDATTGCYVLLCISDDGEGMSPEVCERVFEPFFTTKAEGRGTGLGLATVYGIVRQLGGFIWIYSEPGEGTTLKIYFPCDDSKKDAFAAPERPPTSIAGQAPGRVLLVEDDPKVRSTTLRALKAAGHRVWVAERAAPALELFDAHADAIEVVVSDMVMPGMSGEELARSLRERSETLGLLMISGYTDNGLARTGRIENADRFLQKPFSPATLVRVVGELLVTVRERQAQGRS